MKRKEAIIRYLGHVGWASRHQIAEHIKASPELTSVRLSELKRVAIARNVEWANGIKVWVLTEEGGNGSSIMPDAIEKERIKYPNVVEWFSGKP